MAQSSLIQVRVEESFKKDADSLFANLGLDTPTAIRIFLKQAMIHQGLPFDVNTGATSIQIEQKASDEELFGISDYLIEQNKEAYEVLAQ